MQFSPLTPVGGVTGPLALVPEDGIAGCAASGFASLASTTTAAAPRACSRRRCSSAASPGSATRSGSPRGAQRSSAGISYDPCYHSACDTIDSINMFAFERNVDAVAWTVGMYATSTAGVNEAQSPGSAVGSPAAHDHE